jgi:phosphotransferase system enzyme I (PtsI)
VILKEVDIGKEVVFKGLALSNGVAVARVCRFNENRHSNLPVYRVEGKGVDREIARVKRAVLIALERIEAVRKETAVKIGPSEAEIFTAQKMIIEDESLNEKISDLIRREKTNAESAVMTVFDSYEMRIRELDNEYMKERASDITEVKRRLLDVLANMNPSFQCVDQEHCQRGRNRVIVATELTPALTMELDTSHTMAFVTERGGVNSHAAILARALGIPAVAGIHNIHRILTCGTEIIVDGANGTVIVWPAEATIARIREDMKGAVRTPRAVPPVPGFAVMANISTSSEIDEAVEMQAEGVGLYRTEFEFMIAGRLLNEDEQYERYSSVVKAVAGKPVTFRMFDAGGDKPLPFLEIPKEDNPALGWRGGRLLLGHPALMETQARALTRASEHGRVNVLYPMVVGVDQYRALVDRFVQAVDGMPCHNLRHGVMFEVPSACLDASAIFEIADFGSIGTNDLVQYLFAVDRNNELVADDYSPDQPVFWSLIQQISESAAAAKKPLSVCGELAGDPRYVGKLMSVGIDTVSVSPRLIPGARVAAELWTEKMANKE